MKTTDPEKSKGTSPPLSGVETTAEVGKTKNGTPEFGEIFHTVVGKKVNETYYPKFTEFPQGEEFYQLFLKAGSNLNAPSNSISIKLQETANWIFERFHEEIQEELWNVISSKAKKDNWAKNLPERLQQLHSGDPKLLVWLRSKAYKPERNISLIATKQIMSLCEKMDTVPVFVGQKMEGMSESDVGIWEFYKDDYEDNWFAEDCIAKQLWYLNFLYENCGVIASIGMMSGALDGLPMFCGKKAVFLARKEDATPRMVKVSAVVPAMHWVELVYSRAFKKLSERELAEIKWRIWG